MTSAGVQIQAFGGLLKQWRRRRRLSQLDLAIAADVSPRHVSFIETGRSTPSRAMVLRLADVLDVPRREQNQLLLAAGLAPVYPERSLDDPDMAAVRAGIDRVLNARWTSRPPSSPSRPSCPPTRQPRPPCVEPS